MDRLKIEGGHKLSGTVEVSGSKNATLPILLATILTDKKCILRRVPDLHDIQTSIQLLNHIGVKTEAKMWDHTIEVDASKITSQEAPYDLVRKMRASVVVLGPLLTRFGYAKVSLPGGCAIGARPVNYHIQALEKMGAEIKLENGYIIAKANRLKGARIAFEFPSVGATQNTIMAAVLAKGTTILENSAREPEIIDLANFLNSMGAKISGAGGERIEIEGVESLGKTDYQIMGDRIEAGTFLSAAFATGGSVVVKGIEPNTLEAVLEKFEQAGAIIVRGNNEIGIQSNQKPKATDVTTLPFPGFPTDMQAQFMALMCVASLESGASVIRETVFENRFMHVPELVRMGADISIHGNTAVIKGGKKLIGAPVMATDLRASASLIIAALCADGETIINRIYHLDRGYEKMEKKLTQLGAKVERIK